MQIDLQDQVALVTGSAHRVGKAIAMELARRGVNIIVHYYNSDDETVKETLRDIKSLGVAAFSAQGDVSAPDGVETIFDAAREHFGRLNILVNSASAFIKGTLMDTSLEDWEKSIRVNMTGAFLCAKAAVPLMRENDPPGGAIVNICDKGAVEAWPSMAGHGVSKAGLYALSQVMALEFAPEIRTNVVIPGAVLKPESTSDDDWNKLVRQNVPLQRGGAADDVARAVAYLVSESFINGATIRVDGGEYAR